MEEGRQGVELTLKGFHLVRGRVCTGRGREGVGWLLEEVGKG